MRSDSELQKAVIRELAWDTRVDETAIGVSVHHGVVTLNGAVPGWAQKNAAGEAAHRVAGVRDVANDIDIKPSWSSKRSDSDIAEAVRHALEWDVFVPERQIQSDVTDDGHVTLTGVVSTLQQRDDAEAAVSRLAGVRLVTNQITVEPPAVAATELRGSIKEALERHVAREADRIAIDVTGGTVVLSGRVGSWTERQAVLGAARGTPGVSQIEDHLRIEL
ncbi:MAG TPA: BON domain-containing protein [Kofleriaceae bacterium]|nr:BON domain-containing protein [Kofleriaceae bacterium]